MAGEKRERGRPPNKFLPPRIEATPEQLARAMFAMPVDHEWKYTKEEAPDYQCGRCGWIISYPEVLSVSGLCPKCATS